MAIKTIRTMRLVVSLGLLGAVLVGSVTGNHDFGAVDPRLFGAGVGAFLAVVFKLSHLI